MLARVVSFSKRPIWHSYRIPANVQKLTNRWQHKCARCCSAMRALRCPDIAQLQAYVKFEKVAGNSMCARSRVHRHCVGAATLQARATAKRPASASLHIANGGQSISGCAAKPCHISHVAVTSSHVRLASHLTSAAACAWRLALSSALQRGSAQASTAWESVTEERKTARACHFAALTLSAA